MIHFRSKTFIRCVSALTLFASLSFSSAMAYNGDPELAFTEPAIVDTVDTTQQPDALLAQTEYRVDEIASGDVVPRTIEKSDALAASADIISSATALGSFRLSFYCPCSICGGGSTSGKTKMGTPITEGRSIAVDTSVIPLGSQVYIDGYGLFVAEDIGGAIEGNKIDIAVSNHERAYELGIDNAEVYLLN